MDGGKAIVQALRRHARPLAGDDVGPVMDMIADADVVLLGEATHGTHEFYALRAAITRRLIEERGFDAVAVEADWPDALAVSRYVQGRSPAHDADQALGQFTRFPRWMWRNKEVRALVRWLRQHNDRIGEHQRKVGFYGLDLYSLQDSIRGVVEYLERTDKEAAREARRRYACFDGRLHNPQDYGFTVEYGLRNECERQAVEQLQAMFYALDADIGSAEAVDERFYAQQNARVVRNAERYYRTMFKGSNASWNARDTHMAETLDELRAHLSAQRGRAARIVVWAHNSHIGDARATEPGRHGQHNLGQLVRQCPSMQGQTFLLGFTTHTGTVAAASDWGEAVEHKRVRPSRADSWENLLHRTGLPGFCADLRGALRAPTSATRLERAIGVIYLPQSERLSHYFEAVLADQFDGIVHVDHTRAVTPLDPSARWNELREPETYPSGM
ncbi:MAG TPA: erythromycin esterase family protein [Lysobacter sp.]|nr:erythromycin esterase family protein [Lysobacter sp.]